MSAHEVVIIAIKLEATITLRPVTAFSLFIVPELQPLAASVQLVSIGSSIQSVWFQRKTRAFLPLLTVSRGITGTSAIGWNITFLPLKIKSNLILSVVMV